MTWYDAYTRWEASSKDACAAAAIIDFCDENDIFLLKAVEPSPMIVDTVLTVRYIQELDRLFKIFGHHVICKDQASVDKIQSYTPIPIEKFLRRRVQPKVI